MSAIGIVTVVTNEKNNLKDFFDALVSQTFNDFTLYFVDNNSTDGSPEYFKELNNQQRIPVKYINLDYNSGFSAGSNSGAKEAIRDGCEYLFIVNNDVVMDSRCLEELKKCIESDSSIVCSGLLLFKHKEKYPGVIQEFGGSINFKNGKLLKNYENAVYNEIKLPEYLDTDFVGGGVCFIKTKIFEAVGMYEEMYFGYFDEIDISYRLKVLNNYKMRVTSRAIAYHNHNWTKKNKRSYYFEYFLSERNKFLYLKKFSLHLSVFTNWISDSFKFPWRLIWFMRVCDINLGLYYLRGMYAGLLNHKGKPKFVK
ncbi:MAG: glycosyltransferase family 2 protein [Ignavibacteria bacterium]